MIRRTRTARRPSEDTPSFGNVNEERLVDAALRAADVPGPVLAAQRPPLPQIDLWRPRMGYDRRALTVTEVLAVNRLYRDRRWDISGGPHDWQASSRFAERLF